MERAVLILILTLVSASIGTMTGLGTSRMPNTVPAGHSVVRCWRRSKREGCMSKRLMIDACGWGFLLWLVGYGLGILLFTIVPISLIGWIITPIGTALTIWVLLKKIQATTLRHYIWLSVVWTLIAVVSDYFFLVKAFKPADGYYKLDVYLYYALTFVLPLFIGWKKTRSMV